MSMYHGDSLIRDFIPNDHSRQVSSKYLVEKILRSREIHTVLDLGCGAGDSIDYFRKVEPETKWFGIDLLTSPEVGSRTRKDINICSYDGVRLPVKDNSVDLVYFHQVLEHVERPYELIREIGRIIRSKGFLVGSVSHLEPFHSLSVSNFTPYGLTVLLEYGGLRVIEMRPGIDVLSLLVYRISGKIVPLKRVFSTFFETESPFNSLIRLLGRIRQKSDQEINLIELLFCGQYRFIATKG
jgi:SAM-dependent methyltransferase